MEAREFFDQLMRLRPGEGYITHTYTGADGEPQTDYIRRSFTTFYVWNEQTKPFRVPSWPGSCFNVETVGDFRIRRFASEVLKHYGFPTPELDFDNVARYGGRFAAYEYHPAGKFTRIVSTKRIVAFGDTAAEAHNNYCVWLGLDHEAYANPRSLSTKLDMA